jgi:hypothetical protein
MRGIQVNDSVYADLFKSNVWEKAGLTVGKTKEPKTEAPIVESEEPKEEILVEDEEKHICPLCESELSEGLSDDKIQEHVNHIFSILNEAFDTDESLTETPAEGETGQDDEAK